MRRIAFLVRMLLRYGSSKNCPFCESASTTLVARKYLLLQLRRCDACGLRFRWPGDSRNFSFNFYQKSYRNIGLVSDLPDRESLERLKAANFAGSKLDFTTRLKLLKTLVPVGRVLDFGCSWGYAVWQMKQMGFDAVCFEISGPRAEAGRRELGVEIIGSYEELDRLPSHSFDCIFTVHVLEHLGSLKEVFAVFQRLLKPGGALLIMVPNCGGLQARQQGIRYGAMINEKHVNAFTREFFDRNLPPFGFDVATLSDYSDPVAVRDAIAQGTRLHTDGEDLTVVAYSTPAA